MPAPAPLALICSVPFECERLRGWLADAAPIEVGRKQAWSGVLDGAPVVVFPAGMGKTNAAQGLTALLETRPVRGVLGFGVGGAYPGSGLEIGDVVLASRAVYGDEGVEAPGGWISTEGIGIPLLERGGKRFFNEFDLPDILYISMHGGATHVLETASFRVDLGELPVHVGPIVTLSACSGTAARGEELARRFGALCEGMEGAALAHVATNYEVPFLELRAISNLVEDRDLSRWRLREAAEAAQEAVRVVVGRWEDRGGKGG